MKRYRYNDNEGVATISFDYISTEMFRKNTDRVESEIFDMLSSVGLSPMETVIYEGDIDYSGYPEYRNLDIAQFTTDFEYFADGYDREWIEQSVIDIVSAFGSEVVGISIFDSTEFYNQPV